MTLLNHGIVMGSRELYRYFPDYRGEDIDAVYTW